MIFGVKLSPQARNRFINIAIFFAALVLVAWGYHSLSDAILQAPKQEPGQHFTQALFNPIVKVGEPLRFMYHFSPIPEGCQVYSIRRIFERFTHQSVAENLYRVELPLRDQNYSLVELNLPPGYYDITVFVAINCWDQSYVRVPPIYRFTVVE